MVKIWDCNVDCDFFAVSFSATFPKSPIFFHSSVTFDSVFPVDFAMALIAN